MSIPSGVSIADECFTALNDLRSGRGANKPRFIIYKISDDQRAVIVEESGSERDYEVFRQNLSTAIDKNGRQIPRYAVYDVEYDLGEDGNRTKTIFVSWVPEGTPIKLGIIYASTREQLRKALNIGVSIHADSLDEIEWENILREASGGRA